MSITFLLENRTQYRHLLDTQLANGACLLQEDRSEGEIKAKLMTVNYCIKTLNVLLQKLEDVGEKMSIVVEGQEGEAEIIDLIKDD